MKTTPSGLQYEDVVIGEGAAAEAGRRVLVHYTGWLYIEGKKGSRTPVRASGTYPHDPALRRFTSVGLAQFTAPARGRG